MATIGKDGITRAALFSSCKTWRYSLDRSWSDGDLFPSEKGFVLFVLLNPSTANAEKDDPTNRRGISFAKRWGYSGVTFCNLFAYRTPYPSVMLKAPDPIGPDNDKHILGYADIASLIVVAWGANGGYKGRDAEVLKILERYELFCMGRTLNGGFPRHPLYLRKDTALEPFTVTEGGA